MLIPSKNAFTVISKLLFDPMSGYLAKVTHEISLHMADSYSQLLPEYLHFYV